MTNKPMLSVERELRGAVEQALLAIKRVYQAGHDSITAAGGACDQPGVMFENDPTVRELRALLEKEVDGNSHAPKCQGEPVAWVVFDNGFIDDHTVVKAVADEWVDRGIEVTPLYAEQPAPVAVVMPGRKCQAYKDWRDWTQEEIGYNKALDDIARLNGVKP